MYGTIFNISVKEGHESALLEIMDERVPKGMVAWFLMKPDDPNSGFMGVAVFESKESYISNANSSDQHIAFTKMMSHLNSEPTWTDGEYISSRIA